MQGYTAAPFKEDQSMRKIILCWLLVMVTAGLIACGQKGPLFLPSDEKPVEKQKPSGS
jgi:predicted small lipoprotein YifL